MAYICKDKLEREIEVRSMLKQNILKHQVVISVSDSKEKSKTVLMGGDIRLRDRFLNLLFGNKQRVLVLVPSDSVESVAIKEVRRDAAL